MTQAPWTEHEVAQVRIELAHGVVQLLCDRTDVDALHIKGLALDPALRHPGRVSTDLDLLVRPADVAALRATLRHHGWTQCGRFATGSPFGHAENWHHETLGYLDLHRLIPGVGLSPDDAFDRFWGTRHTISLAQVECAVPSRDAQTLVLLLHAARSHGEHRAELDVEHVWRSQDPATRQRVRELVTGLQAEVAFAAAAGDLENYRNRPDYLLWKVSSSSESSRTTEWRARIQAAPGVRQKAALVLRAGLVNRDHLRALVGREPTPRELLHEFVRRGRQAVRELAGRDRRQ